jgi:hypothetical protein
VTVKEGMDWAVRQTRAEVMDVVPRYHPRWAYPLLKVPGARELLTWNLAIGMRRR